MLQKNNPNSDMCTYHLSFITFQILTKKRVQLWYKIIFLDGLEKNNTVYKIIPHLLLTLLAVIKKANGNIFKIPKNKHNICTK